MCAIVRLIVIVTCYLTIGSAVNIANGKSSCPEMLPQFAFWRAFFISVIVSDSSPSYCCYYCCYRKESISLLILSLVAGAQELLVLLLPLTMTNSKPCLDDKDIFALVVNLVVFVCVYRKSILLTHIFVTIFCC